MKSKYAELLSKNFGPFGTNSLQIFNFLINKPAHDNSAFRKYRKSLFMFEKRFAHGRKSSDISAFMDILLRLVKYISHHIGISSSPVRISLLMHDPNILRDHSISRVQNDRKFPRSIWQQEPSTSDPGPNRSCRDPEPSEAAKRIGKGQIRRLLYSLARFISRQIIELGPSRTTLLYGLWKSGRYNYHYQSATGCISLRNFTAAGLQQVTAINDFDNVISQTFSPLKSDTLAFIDGNHTLMRRFVITAFWECIRLGASWYWMI
jgi:hypothetical protein